MSLNGLEDAKVSEAYTAALAEAGGWFLLRYASRDAVEVLTRGTGGAADARGAIANYDAKSPLYGFLLYRRRKVLIKYVPDGTSRLLQARVAVQFIAITEKFTPHDTVISIATADELSDAALASACSLHTAAPSSSSSCSSMRLHHKLDEITEDAEEGQSTAGESTSTARPATADSKATVTRDPTETTRDQMATMAAPEQRTKLAEDGKKPPEISHVTIEAVTATEEHAGPKTSPLGKTFKHYDSLFEDGPDPRLSSQTARPALSDLYADIYAQYNKPKVKLAPRPKQSLDTKRPRTSGTGTGAQSIARPVSSLPSGLRAAKRTTVEPKRPKSRDSSVVPGIALLPPPPIPAIPEVPASPSYAPKSPGSVRSMPMHTYSSHGSRSGISPEKQRLMKAMEMRKKQMKAKKEREQMVAQATPDAADVGVEDTAKDAEAEVHPDSSMETVAEEANSPTLVQESTAEPAAIPSESESTPSNQETSIADSKSSFEQEESGVGLTSRHMDTDDMHSAASASSPTSAQTQGSSCAPSTRPSSVSEDDHQLPADETKVEDQSDLSAQSGESPTEDEEASVESAPTVVPESTTPIPTVEISSQADEAPTAAPQPTTSDDFLGRRGKRESMVFMPPSDSDDAHSRRKSKPKSMLFMPPSDLQDAIHSRKQKRESIIMSSPAVDTFADYGEARRVMLDPSHLSAENSEAEYLSDDSFMEELQSAKFEEAKPMSVSKSPMMAVFPRKAAASSSFVPQISASQYAAGRLTPDRPSSRQSSGSWLQHANTDPVVTAKKINVSSGISQRIKALAEKSNRDSTASVSPNGSPEASTSLVAQRKSSFFTTPPTGNSPTGKPVGRFSHVPFAHLSDTTPNKKPVLQQPLTSTIQRHTSVIQQSQEPEKPESVQVTARIVRDSRMQKPNLQMPTESTPLELHQSPIVIDHQKSTRPSSRSRRSPVRTEPTSPRPPTASSTKDASAGLPRSSSELSWRSFGRRMSETKSGPAPRSQSTHSFESGDERSEKREKKDSRTSKFFKRMSTIPSMSRKNSTASSTLPEDDHQAFSLPLLREPPPPVQVGDLNIQFPDTLLWKRRWVEVDASGNLVLTLSKYNEQSKGITKRFHLSELRPPYAPDQDRQELPNSVVLDFIDGRTLQCACETSTAQAQVLQILREAHDAWLAYGQGQ